MYMAIYVLPFRNLKCAARLGLYLHLLQKFMSFFNIIVVGTILQRSVVLILVSCRIWVWFKL